MVINIKDAPKGWQDDDTYVYVGRQRSLQSVGDFGNPYVISGTQDRVTVISRYIQWLTLELQCNTELQERIANLDGKIKVCHCHPLACHGDILDELSAFLRHVIDEGGTNTGFLDRWGRERQLSAFMIGTRVQWQQKVLSTMCTTARNNLKHVKDFETFKVFRRRYLNRALRWKMPEYVPPDKICQ